MTVASDLAEVLLAQLGQDFTVPAIDLSGDEFALPSTVGNPRYDDIPDLYVEDLTTGVVNGEGVFDKIMSSNRAHLREQYEKGLISGDQYTKAYIELTVASLSAATQFLIQGKLTYWQALTAQSEARAAEVMAVRAAVELETAKYKLAEATYQAEMLKAQNALVQMQLSTEDAKYNLVLKQQALVVEQTEAQRAQTLDTRMDGITAVSGITGAQKALYDQQVESYKRDVDHKLGKLWADAWTVQKTLDEGLLAPTEFTNAEIDAVLSKVKTNAGLS